MIKGMGWFDATKKTVEEKILDAANWYQQKYGVRPNTCLVSLANWPEEWGAEREIQGIRTLPDKYTWANGLLIGVEVKS